LVNVSELREYVMEARMIAELSWNASQAFAQPGAADRYLQWWAREYFGAAAADEVVGSYRGYYQLLGSWDQISAGSNQVLNAVTALDNRFKGKAVAATDSSVMASLRERDTAYRAVFQIADGASARMSPDRQQYFFEHVTFPLLIDWRQTTAAIKLIQAAVEPEQATVRKLCLEAFDDLKRLEAEIHRAGRSPFEGWYRKTWIRSDESPYNIHRSYEHLLTLLVEYYLKP